MVELRRALQENSTVREPLLNARYEKQEVSTHNGCAAIPMPPSSSVPGMHGEVLTLTL
jgi:hypothetical protein